MYNKLFTKILDSSIWLEPAGTRLVWLTMLAVMDEDGFCQFAGPANVAHRARVSLDDAMDALQVLESPDQESSDPEHDGRRIERVPGGWMVLNARKHGEIVTRAVMLTRTRERMRRYRARQKEGRVPVSDAAVTVSNATVTPSDTDTDTDVQVRRGPVGPPFASPSDLVSLWNQLVTPPIPQVTKLTADRARKITARLLVYPDLAMWRTVIAWINTQDWMRASGTGDHPNWTATLDWLCKSDGQVAKYLERAVTPDGVKRESVSASRQAPEWVRRARGEI